MKGRGDPGEGRDIFHPLINSPKTRLRAGPCQELGMLSESLLWVAGTWALRLSSAVLPGSAAGSWMGSSAARPGPCIPTLSSLAGPATTLAPLPAFPHVSPPQSDALNAVGGVGLWWVTLFVLLENAACKCALSTHLQPLQVLLLVKVLQGTPSGVGGQLDSAAGHAQLRFPCPLTGFPLRGKAQMRKGWIFKIS